MTQEDVVYSIICIKNVFLIHSLQSSFLLRSGFINPQYVKENSDHYHLDKVDHFYFIFYILSPFTNNLHKNKVKSTLLKI